MADLKQGWKIKVAGTPSNWLWVATLAEAEEFMREEVAEAVRVDDGHPGFTVEVSTLDPGGIGEFDGW